MRCSPEAGSPETGDCGPQESAAGRLSTTTGCSIFAAGRFMIAAGCSIPAAGRCISAAGRFMIAAGCSIPAAGSSISAAAKARITCIVLTRCSRQKPVMLQCCSQAGALHTHDAHLGFTSVQDSAGFGHPMSFL